jgi:DNA uptake protein ComE-like DNA-binding protein
MTIVTPRTKYLLDVINTRDVAQIKSLNGLGAKRAEGIVEHLNEQTSEEDEFVGLRNWTDLAGLRGIGKKTLESMREGVVI